MNPLWTPERLKLLRELCDCGFKASLIADRMGLKRSQIRNAMAKYNIKNGRIGFQNNNKPWNKGKRYSKPELGLHLKGKKPHNEMSNETTSRWKDGRLKIKVNGRWVSLASHLWVQAGNQIPKGYIVRFKSPDSEPVLENVICVSRAENARLNQNRKKAAKTMRENNAEKRKLYNPRTIPWYLATSSPRSEIKFEIER